jgi:hypothetical protein
MDSPIVSFIAISLVSALSFTIHAEIFKCIDLAGQPSYQETSCPAGTLPEPLQVEYSNTLELGITPQDRQLIDEIHDQRQSRVRRRISQRAHAMDLIMKRYRAKQSTCRKLKLQLETTREQNRRGIETNPQDLIGQTQKTRQACSAGK